MENILTDMKETRNLRICYFGEEACEPGHFHGPAVRENYLIHYVVSGQGFYEINNTRYNLSAGQGFFIPPGAVTYYEADQKDPWFYTWVGLQGMDVHQLLKKAGLHHQKKYYLFHYDRDDKLTSLFQQMNDIRFMSQGREEILLGLAYQILGLLIHQAPVQDEGNEKESSQKIYFQEALMYIENNYYKNLSIHDLSAYLGIDRSYLFMIFKKYLGVSPKEYMMEYRFKKACRLLSSTSLPISNIALSIGYKDALTFSKAFKKFTGIAPRHYRQSATHDL